MAASLLAIARAADVAIAPAAPVKKVDFERDVRPILRTHCLKCHGHETHEADLDLTMRESAIEKGAIIERSPDKSELLRRVTSTHAEERMPPKGALLSANEIETLRAWIAQGAAWPKHWAYRPLVEPTVPEIGLETNRSWARNDIDHFIASRLERENLAPSPEADRRTLLRRLSFDLLGLPPTPEEVEAFAADKDPQAYERRVEAMLASPHFGERQARHWMDVVHFAETHGHEHDKPRENAWRYRDYLIQSFNADKPYDRFVAEQVAGDILFPDDPSATVATGFLAAGPWDFSSLVGSAEDSFDHLIGQYLDRDDIITTVMSTFTSASVHCARCHDHKFDPISQKEYYALQAVFAGVDRADRKFDPDPEVARRRRALKARKELLATAGPARDAALQSAETQTELATWETENRSRAISWRPLELLEVRSEGGATLKKLEDGSYLAEGARPEKDIYIGVAKSDLARVTAIRLELLPHDSLPQKGPGRMDNGNLHLNELKVFEIGAAEDSAWKPIALAKPASSFDQKDWTVAAAIDGNPNTAWGIHPEVGKSHHARFEFAAPVPTKEGARLRIELHQIHGGGHLIGRFRILATDAATPLPEELKNFSPELVAIAQKERSQRTAEEHSQLSLWFANDKTDRELAALPEQEKVWSVTNDFEGQLAFQPAKTPRKIELLNRGQANEPKGEVSPGALACMEGVPFELSPERAGAEAERRAALARWLSDKRNVLTWRAIVNRLWQQHFGAGLVETPNDFGQMGAAPSHPELLDWLAVSLQKENGSLKGIHRLIVTSAAYRQSSQAREDADAFDGSNRLLWRQNRRRLDAEQFRDALLVASDTLDRTMGGPSVKQFVMGPGVSFTPKVDYANFNVDDPANRRRSVYRFLFRTLPDPLMNALDCPDATQLTPTRTVSLTPLQALATLNDKFVIRQSELLARRAEQGGAETAERVREAYRRVLCRAPSEEEVAELTAYADKHGLANACRLLINANEFLFVD